MIVGTSSGGVFKQIDDRPSFISINDGLSSHDARCVWAIKNIGGKIYIGTSEGIYSLDSSAKGGDRVTKVPK